MELSKALEELKKIGKKNSNVIDEKTIFNYVSEFDYDEALEFLDKEGIEILALEEDELNPINIEKDYESIIKTNDIVKIYFNEIGVYNILSTEEEIDLFKKYNEGKAAKEKIKEIEADDLNTISEEEYKKLYNLSDLGDAAYEKIIYSNLKLVASIAKRYSKRGMSLLDLIQEGNMGLQRAIDKFDYKKGNKFSTYATPWIKQGITRSLTDKSRTIRLPSYLLDTISKIKKVEDELEQELKRKPTYDEISKKTGIPKEKIASILDSYQIPISLEKPVGDEDDATIGDFVADKNNPNPFEYCKNIALKHDLYKLINNNLTEREAEILKLRFGLSDGNPKTLEEIGKLMGNVSKERIRQIEFKALRKLQNLKETKILKESYRK